MVGNRTGQCSFLGEPAVIEDRKGTSSIRDCWIRIPSANMRMLGVLSPNRSYALGMLDRDTENNSGRGGFRHRGLGLFALCGRTVLACDNAERPMDGAVSNNGIFVVVDSKFGSNLESRMLAFDTDGKLLLAHDFSANCVNVAISNDGRNAVFQCANSWAMDSGKLFMFDLLRREVMWSVTPEIGWGRSYSFEDGGAVIRSHIDGDRSYRFRVSDGEFLDHAKKERDWMKLANSISLVESAMEDIKKSPDNVDMKQAASIIAKISRAKARDDGAYPGITARIYRAYGEVYERLGDMDLAISNFEKALDIDPKAGVKIRLKKMKSRG